MQSIVGVILSVRACALLTHNQQPQSAVSHIYKTAACMMPNSPSHSNSASYLYHTTQHIKNACRFGMPFAKEMAMLSIYIASS